eukprot:scaffold24060_cov50-Attheya_sp.AAC.5
MDRLVPISRRKKKGHDIEKQIVPNTTIRHDPNPDDENEIVMFQLQSATRNPHSRLYQIMLLYHANIDRPEKRKGLILLEEEVPENVTVRAAKENPPPIQAHRQNGKTRNDPRKRTSN